MIKCNCCGRENSNYAIYCDGCGSLLSSISESGDINSASHEAEEAPAVEAHSEPEVSSTYETEQPEAVPYPTQDYIPPEYTYTSTPTTTNGMEYDNMCITGFALAVAGNFCCGILSIAGLIMCIIGLVRTRTNGKKGRGLAVAGIIISCTAILFWIVVIATGNGTSYSYYSSGRRR